MNETIGDLDPKKYMSLNQREYVTHDFNIGLIADTQTLHVL